MVELKYSPKFKKIVKKLNTQEKTEALEAVYAIQANPLIGKMLTGDFAGTRAYQFRLNKNSTRITYQYDEEGGLWILMLALGSRENFYRNNK